MRYVVIMKGADGAGYEVRPVTSTEFYWFELWGVVYYQCSTVVYSFTKPEMKLSL